MAVLIFLIWVAFNGRFTAEIAAFGVAVSGALYLFACRFLDYRPRYDLLLAKSLPQAVRYLAVLVREVAVSALTMMGWVFDHRDVPEPLLVSFRPPLETELARTLLAGSITLTPGTITVDMRDGVFQVHCYDRSMAEGLDGSVFVRLLQRWEASL